VLVTAETRNHLYVVDLRSGRMTGRTSLAVDPENVVSHGVAVVVSPRAGAVTLVDPRSLRAFKVIRGFGSPHIPAISPDGRYAFVTDDLRGTLTTIELRDRRVVSRIFVGNGAHHLSFRPDGRRLWIALGESARTIVVLDTSNPVHPRVLGRVDPGYPAHDLAFTPDGQRVWVTSASGPEVGVFSSRNRRVLFRVPVGPPPQHIAFAGPSAYLTSGYGGTIEKVALATGRVLRKTRAPYGSFELDAADGFVVTSSLLRGTVAIYDLRLGHLHTVRVARAARDLAIALR
jgi:DNA-binding beta-propeller fold protein YncE